MKVFYKLLKCMEIHAQGRKKIGIEFSIDNNTKKPFVKKNSGIEPRADGSYWTFYLESKIISIEQFSFGKQDCQLNVREDNLEILDDMFRYAPSYKDCAKIIEELFLEKKIKKRRF